jgi:Flp pilus assembly CpaE family ATPase
MSTLRVAVVSRDPDVRLSAARAFDPAPPSWSVRLYDEPPADADVVIVGPDVDAPGDVVFDPHDPGAVLRAVAGRAGNGGRLVVVTSPSGGTGATSLALHLAAFSAGDSAVCFVDFDHRWGVSERLGIGPDARRWNPSDFSGSVRLAALPVAPGFRVLLAGESGDASEELLSRTIAEFDAVVADVPNAGCLGMALHVAHAAVLVVSPTVTGAARAARLLDEFPDVSWAVVTNRLGAGGETTRSEIERILDRPLALELPCAPALRDAEDTCRLLTSRWFRYARAVARLSTALERI